MTKLYAYEVKFKVWAGAPDYRTETTYVVTTGTDMIERVLRDSGDYEDQYDEAVVVGVTLLGRAFVGA